MFRKEKDNDEDTSKTISIKQKSHKGKKVNSVKSKKDKTVSRKRKRIESEESTSSTRLNEKTKERKPKLSIKIHTDETLSAPYRTISSSSINEVFETEKAFVDTENGKEDQEKEVWEYSDLNNGFIQDRYMDTMYITPQTEKYSEVITKGIFPTTPTMQTMENPILYSPLGNYPFIF